ncbi:GTP-binding protein [Roseomonas fluvialis]
MTIASDSDWSVQTFARDACSRLRAAIGPFRVGIGGTGGSVQAALTERLCRHPRERQGIAAITNDISANENAEFVTRAGALAPKPIAGVETSGCPHTTIREDTSTHPAAVHDMPDELPRLESLFVGSALDKLAAPLSPPRADMTICVSAGDRISRMGSPGFPLSDLLVTDTIGLAPLVGADLRLVRPRFPEDARAADLRIKLT